MAVRARCCAAVQDRRDKRAQELRDRKQAADTAAQEKRKAAETKAKDEEEKRKAAAAAASGEVWRPGSIDKMTHC